ncbi:MAG: lipopolysaccharide biosynthesis protein [Nitrospirota bacterium]
MANSLQHTTVYALLWSFLDAVAQRGVQFIISIVLARLLFPEQFGLIGMLTIFMAVTRTFLDSGFGAALIQKQEVTQTDICSIFYFNIAVGLAAAGLLSLAAPWIAAFYRQPILTPLTRALSLTIVINSFGMIQKTVLTKHINFKVQTKVSLIAGVLSGAAGITLAAHGFGVWSLVVQQISASLFSTVSLWAFSSWRPALIFSFTALRKMFGFGSRLLASSVLNQFFDNIYFVVIGKLFSATDLGFFTRAKTLNDLPSQTLSGIVARVTFPVFSTIQGDRARLKRGLKKALAILVLVNFPLMIGLAVIARPLVLVLLTEKWAACIPYLQLLCVVGILFPLQVMNLNVLQALGRSDLFLRLEIIKKIMIVINIAITWRWGISAMIYGMIINSVISYYLNSYYNGVLVDYPLREQVLDLLPYLIVAIVMGSAVYAAGLPQFLNHWIRLLVQITAGCVLYVGLCRMLRLKAFMEIWQAMWNRMPLASVETVR